jgi:transposase InsO family protein
LRSTGLISESQACYSGRITSFFEKNASVTPCLRSRHNRKRGSVVVHKRRTDRWAYENKVVLHFIMARRPMENGYIESFSRQVPRGMPQRTLVSPVGRCAFSYGTICGRRLKASGSTITRYAHRVPWATWHPRSSRPAMQMWNAKGAFHIRVAATAAASKCCS